MMRVMGGSDGDSGDSGGGSGGIGTTIDQCG